MQRIRDAGPRERPSILWPQREPMRVSSPEDASEREARHVASTVMESSAGRVWSPGTVARAAHRTLHSRALHRQAAGPRTVDADVSREIETSRGSGMPLPADVREFMEPRFGADFGEVRIHTDDQAERLSASLSARAFTYGKDIYFGRGEYRPNERGGAELLAHELTHTIQQRAVVQRIFGIDIGLPDPLSWLADKASVIPGFRLLTIILGVNPINMSAVERSAANILRALIEFLPGGGLITQALDSSGVFDKAGAFVEKQIATLGMAGAAIKAAVTDFIKGLSLPGDLLHPGATWERAKRIFTDPIDRLKSFGVGLVAGIVQLVKDAILPPIAKLAEGTEGYSLLKGVLGKDPITDTPVERSAETLLAPIMKMAGQGEFWEKMQQAKAIPRCWAWFKGVIPQLLAFVSQVPALFVSAFKSLTLEDIILIPKAFAKLAGVFGGFVGKFVSWALNAIWNLLEIIFDVVSPGALVYIKKTGAALKSILENPLPFVGNLVKAAKLGFTNFSEHFLDHLKAGLLDWLIGALPGVYIPKALTLPEFGKFALSVLGISWAQIRGKIVKALGPYGEKIMQGLELAFDIVKALVTGGPAAAWEVIKEKLTGLKDTIVDGIIGFVKDAVITKAIPKLISMFIPGAGFITAIISIYDTVMVFVEKISKIIQVVVAFIDSIVAIAAGNLGAAAAKVERILAGLLSLAINFLAGFVGLGKVADKILGVIAKVREKVDKALDAAIAWVVTKAKALFAKLFDAAKAGVKKLLGWWKREKKFSADGESHRVFFKGDAASAQLRVASDEKSLEDFVKTVVRTAKNGKAIDDITDAQASIKKLRTKRKPPKPDERDPTTDDEIDKLFDLIAGKLPELFSGDAWGTETNPLLLAYPKKSASLYRTLYLGPRVSGRMAQSTLQPHAGSVDPPAAGYDSKEIGTTATSLNAWIAKGGKVHVYTPFTQKSWPDGATLGSSKQLGVAPQFLAQPGTSFDYKKGETPGGKKLNDALKKFGFYGRKNGGENSDGDHILEAQLIGRDAADQIPNMWPLDKTENRHGENLENKADVEVSGRPDLKFKGLLAATQSKDKKKTNRSKGLRVMIKSTVETK